MRWAGCKHQTEKRAQARIPRQEVTVGQSDWKTNNPDDPRIFSAAYETERQLSLVRSLNSNYKLI